MLSAYAGALVELRRREFQPQSGRTAAHAAALAAMQRDLRNFKLGIHGAHCDEHPIASQLTTAMIAFTIRLSDDKHERLKALSKLRGISVSRLIDEMATTLLTEFDAEARFQVRSERGRDKSLRGAVLLRKARGD